MAAGDDFAYLITHPQGEKHRRAPNWTDGEMKALLYIWEENHNELKTSKRNAKVYERMSQRFFQLTGEQRFKEEIKMKITNMSFQYRRLKSNATESGETPDWPYYKAIEKILSKPVEVGQGNWAESQGDCRDESQASTSAGNSSQGGDNPLAQPEQEVMGFLPEYTGSSDEMEIKQELDSWNSDSEHTQGSSSHPVSSKQKTTKRQHFLKRRKLQIMQAMLRQQKRSNQAIEETCREVRRALHQQNLLQVQCMQMQERMMNLLEKMILPSSTSGKNKI
ncbi:myb/SANT-like DNA-binding domain-containing protein 1 isoform X1 [Syngnathus scovelli]|uniref:myb/SANT-like DNA-binding domain-containing protein 1 isoform X1 n=1 Tax=Syngnathus scovelli TaxID=161590 RepID=UPI00210F809A|nr:myb/SANT-like DNA-binding domain-containing protein 1 isoform X1 [Syngnathus scovelli]